MKLIRFAFSFAVGTFLSRILGFLRDAAIAYYFGASHISDAFFVAFRVPNSFRRLLGEGGFNAAFVPLYSQAVEEGREREFLGKIFTLYLVVTSLITFSGVLLSEYIVSLIAPGLRKTETFSLAVFMARFLFLYLILVGINAFFMGVLNVKGRFFIPAITQGVFNAVFLTVLIILADNAGYKALIVGVLVGGIAQVLINFPSIIKADVKFSFVFKIDKDVRLLLSRIIPALGGFGVNQLSLLIDTFLASFLKTGAISYLYYANRLYQLPFGIIAVGVANSLLSLLSKSESHKEREITTALKITVLLIVPASTGLIVLSEEIVRTIYGRGFFSERDILITAGVLSLYSLGLLPYSLQKVISAEFFSRGDTATPVKVFLITVLFEGLLGGILAFGMKMGIYGLPAGTALSSLIGLYFLIRKISISFNRKEVGLAFLRSFGAAFVMGVVLFYLKREINNTLTILFLGIGVGSTLYFSILFLSGEILLLHFFKSLVQKKRNSGGST